MSELDEKVQEKVQYGLLLLKTQDRAGVEEVCEVYS